MRGSDVSKNLVFLDPGTKENQIRTPVLDVVRGYIIATDGIFVTEGPNGAVAGYAARGWTHFPKKELAKALKRSLNTTAAIVPDRNGAADGFVVQLHADDALAYGVDLTTVNVGTEEWAGCITITATAYLYAVAGLYPDFITGPTERSETDLTAIEITAGVEALRLGSTRTTPARAATNNRPARPSVTYPACPEGEVLVKGTIKAPTVAASPYDGIVNNIVVHETEAVARSGYGMSGFSGRGRRR